MILDSMDKTEDRERYQVQMYSPPPGSIDAAELPRGWSDDDEQEQSDAAARELGLL